MKTGAYRHPGRGIIVRGEIASRGMSNFFSELKRRHIYRVAGAYAVVAWLLLQLVNTVAPLLRLPDWAGSFFLVALIVGFPVALIFAWILHLASTDSVGAKSKSTTVDWILHRRARRRDWAHRLRANRYRAQ